MTRKHLSVLTAALLGVSLAACSGSETEPAAVENSAEVTMPSDVEDRVALPTATDTALPPPLAETSIAANAAVDVPPAEEPAPDEQMMDDAAATGMTARVTREGPSDADKIPVEEVEQR